MAMACTDLEPMNSMIAIAQDAGMELVSGDCWETAICKCVVCLKKCKGRPTRENHRENCSFHPLMSVPTGDKRKYSVDFAIIKVGDDVRDELLPGSQMTEVTQSESVQRGPVAPGGEIINQFDRQPVIREINRQPVIQLDRSQDKGRGNSIVTGSDESICKDSELALQQPPPRETRSADDPTLPDNKSMDDRWNRNPSQKYHFDPGRCVRCVICGKSGNLLGLCHLTMLCTRCFFTRNPCARCGGAVLFAELILSMYHSEH